MHRRCFPLLLLAACLVLPGCVYLRLLDLRDQCADFDRHLTLGPGPGLRLGFRHPVLRSGDVDLLVGGPPTATAPSPGGVVEVWAFHRRDPSRAAGRPMLLAVHQAAGRVEAIDLPQEIAQVVPPELLRAGLRALGKARVDVAGRRAEAAVSPGEGIPTVPTLDAVMAVLGPPDELQVHAQGGTRAIWRYTLTSRPTVPVALALDVRPGASRPSRVIVSVNGLWGYLDLP